MRHTLRRLAAVKPVRYLEAGNPTGLTGVYTHSTPRSTLIFLYTLTLQKLKRFPESSLYRQSVEALTKHRQAIVEAAEPPGHKEWQVRAQKVLDENPGLFRIRTEATPEGAMAAKTLAPGAGGAGHRMFIHRQDPQPKDIRYQEWDGVKRDDRLPNRGGTLLRQIEEAGARGQEKKVEWEPEPQLTADQVEEIEAKIGGGLIEEVVRVAENELKLVDIMHENKVWEDLEEKPAEGQWTYFERHS
ncbi:ETC complex I subunit conserved region-domain-containing protein [Whalleya microplaca]|nr:ETC complex I subunit conserved region-domain-containing protein [Whalleya microplaca]